MATKENIIQLFQQLGTDPTLGTFQDRLRIQKIVYLAEEAFKIDLGFRFTWYINGPYSPGLSKVMFGKDVGTPSTVEVEKIDRMKSFVRDFVESSEELELVGSLHYLLKIAKKEGKSPDYAVELLEELKPQFSKAKAQKYVSAVTALAQ